MPDGKQEKDEDILFVESEQRFIAAMPERCRPCVRTIARAGFVALDSASGAIDEQTLRETISLEAESREKHCILGAVGVAGCAGGAQTCRFGRRS